jgi:hypothetical protein
MLQGAFQQAAAGLIPKTHCAQNHPTPQIALIVIDSVTFHFRQDWPDAGLRSRLLAGMAQDAIALAESRGLALVFMNQVTTKVAGGEGAGVLVPALGESWGQASSTRVALFWEGPQRRAHLLKASAPPPGFGAPAGSGVAGQQAAQRRGPGGGRQAATVAFDVTAEGVRSAVTAAAAAAAAAAPAGWPPQGQQHGRQPHQQGQQQAWGQSGSGW